MDTVAASQPRTDGRCASSGRASSGRVASRGVTGSAPFSRLATVSLLAAASLLSACSWTATRPVRKTVTPSGEPPPPPLIMPVSTPPPAPSVDESAALAISPLSPELSVIAIQGASMESARNLFQPAPVAACSPTESGFLRIVITANEDRTAMMVDPSSTANAAMSECVLKALSTVDIDDVLQPSASDATSQVQSIVNIRW